MDWFGFMLQVLGEVVGMIFVRLIITRSFIVGIRIWLPVWSVYGRASKDYCLGYQHFAIYLILVLWMTTPWDPYLLICQRKGSAGFTIETMQEVGDAGLFWCKANLDQRPISFRRLRMSGKYRLISSLILHNPQPAFISWPLYWFFGLLIGCGQWLQIARSSICGEGLRSEVKIVGFG